MRRATLLLLTVAALIQSDAAERPNVLFIAVDDLRPALGCYGDKTAITPNMDLLAKRGVVFSRAYCQQAVCSPSRLSMLTGLRPDTIKVWDLRTHFRVAKPEIVTLPQLFKRNGYHTQSIGKIFHGSGKPSKDPPSWSVTPQYDYVRDAKLRYALPANLAGKGMKRAAAESADVADDRYIDGIVCEAAVSTLGELAKADRPFFLAVGFRKPHLPFCAPRKYWELYNRNKISFPVYANHPTSAPELATRSWRELEGYSDISQDGQLTVEKVRELRHGYYACVSYIDALIGRLLAELDKKRLAQNTLIVLWGDHGFHLGEQGLWTKANNYELATRIPLIIVDPRRNAKQSTTCNGLVELVDVYPTLAELCELELQRTVEGISLKPLLENSGRTWKTAAFSQYPRAKSGHRHRSHGDIMGYAIRTNRYRYVEWRKWGTKKILARELYDHRFDPHESKNIARSYGAAPVMEELESRLTKGWRAALPLQLKQEE